ncbi:DUF3326 domain-containing protein [Dolichospermum planctonicum CS-1226]|uniref:DUF3326 domain-containing protein n=1 Tax=Dolichospermum planctonicum CS-1226 TaxID=3021751 RepID=A0ABT5AHN3_9CYAN|nr:DUF3326 domain-containing protein [Dolichospermum planctonicum]MDB9536798.1 DUF3326 domain-containing protein [Dolichospermum planctonicum CS-1226]
MQKPYTVILIIPTGIGAAIGGYAGDALPVARIISQVCDRLITHPNVMNGASLYWNIPNAFYVEGYGLDKFAAGEWGLRPVRSNTVGLLLDQGIEPELMLRHLQVADAARATLGLNITNHVITDAKLNVELRSSSSGTSWGTIGNPDSLLRGAEKLIIQEKAQAIAVVTRFPEDMDETALQNYRQGQGVDPLAGAEAVISHLLVRTFKIPCAHAPALSPAPTATNLSPRAAAEELGYTFLPCVLVGLSSAPQFLINTESYKPLSTDLWADQVDALIIPDTSCGSSALFSLSQSQCQIITVTENKTLLQVSAHKLKIPTWRVNSYLEAVGVLVAHKAGINPFSLMI